MGVARGSIREAARQMGSVLLGSPMVMTSQGGGAKTHMTGLKGPVRFMRIVTDVTSMTAMRSYLFR